MFYNEIKFNSIEDYIAYLFEFDTVSIVHKPNGHIIVDAEISTGETVINFYKIFISFLDEIDKCEKDFAPLLTFKGALKRFKDEFDTKMDDKKSDLEKFFAKHNPTINISYSGEFGKIYNRVKSMVG